MITQPAFWVAWVLTIACILVAPLITPIWLLSILIILFSMTLFLIPGTKYAAISFIVIAVLYGVGWLPLFVLSSTLAIMVNGEGAYRSLAGSRYAFVGYIVAGIAGSFFVMYYLNHVVPLISLLGVIVAVLLKSALLNRADLPMVEGLGVAMTMYFFDELHFYPDTTVLLTAVIIGFSFGYLAHRIGAMDLSGLFSGALIGLILIVFTQNVAWFFIMLTFFILGSVATKYKYAYKVSLGSAQGHGGVRGYYNVFANGLVATAAAILFGITQHPMFIAMFLGSVATATADTVAGEIGMTGGRPYLITTWERVPAGTNGGISLIGEITGVASAIVILAVAFLLGVSTIPMAIIGVAAGFLGTNMDSLIGATLENEGLIGNAGTNLLATLFGGLFATVLFSLLGL
ncbi:MAG: DUF92 domain-containing protein [Methanomicrobiales archaeon]|nr:DUF92 domain-containing protein [Methanomicrobiales archaeon]